MTHLRRRFVVNVTAIIEYGEQFSTLINQAYDAPVRASYHCPRPPAPEGSAWRGHRFALFVIKAVEQVRTSIGTAA